MDTKQQETNEYSAYMDGKRDGFIDSVKNPFVIGITGHCDLETSEADIRKALARIFEELKKHFPESPFLLLSALAPGADMIFFQQAHESLKDRKTQYRIVIPFDLDTYKEKQQKGHDGWLDQFEDYAKKYPVVNAGETEGSHPAKYFPAGKYIADRADLLIAVWDGLYILDETDMKQMKRGGGTSHVVDYALFPEHDDISVLPSDKPTANILQIYAKAKKDNKKKAEYFQEGPVPCEPGGIFRIALDPYGKTTAHSIPQDEMIFHYPGWFYRFLQNRFSLSKTKNEMPVYWMLKESFNREAARFFTPRMNSEEQAEANDKAAFNRIRKESLTPDDPEKDTVRRCFCASLAESMQDRFNRQFHRLFWLSFLAGGAVQVYGGVDLGAMPIYRYAVLIYLIMLAVVFIYYCCMRSYYHNSYLNYRILAEALRVQIHWNYAGLNRFVADEFQNALSLRNDFCTRMLVRWQDSDRMACRKRLSGTIQFDAFEKIRKNWVSSQKTYYKKNSLKYRKKESLFSILKWSFFLFSLFFAILFALDTFFAPGILNLNTIFYKQLYIYNGLLTSIGAYGFAVVSFYLEKKSFGELADNYSTMMSDYAFVEQNWQGKVPEGNNITLDERDMNWIYKLGVDSLKEHQAWLARYSGNKPEPML